MFKKLKNIFYIFILLLINFTNLIKANEPIQLNTSFGNMPYKIILIDLKPYIAKELKINYAIQNQNILFLKALKENKFIGESFDMQPYINFKRILNKNKIETIPQITDYDDRILDTIKCSKLINNHINISITKKTKKIKDKYGKVFDIKKYDIPEVQDIILDKQNKQINNERFNLFDMFPLIIDQQLLNYGFCEQIYHPSKNNNYDTELQIQITMFGGIVSDQLTTLGFFQYTYSPKTGKWYHRFFKPWTPYCLTKISRSKTQILILNTLKNLLDEFLSKKMTTESFISNEDFNVLLYNFFKTKNQFDYYNGTLEKTIYICNQKSQNKRHNYV
ncbi:hypothetical protein K9L05_00965 [Candidatus Babeliales bacterium]|nr:hypothetical protein [Candidatus Babeliales bacterium]MCF7899202.1 hypothetical protein [Candidatus Babeliales bacterium]